MYKFLLIFLFQISFLITFGQNYNSGNIDSLIFKLGELPEDTTKIHTLIKVLDYYKSTNPDKTLYYSDKLIELSQKLQYNDGLSKAYYYKGNLYFNKAEYKLALMAYLEKIKVDELNNNQNNIAKNLISIGNIYYQLQEYKKAHEYYLKSIQIFQKINNLKGISNAYNNIGNIYEAFRQPEKAEEYYMLSINIDSKIKNYQGLAITNNNLGNLYYKHFNDTSGVKYFYNAIEYLDSFCSPLISVLIFQNLGDYYLWAEKLDSANHYLNKAYLIAQNYNFPFFIRDITLSLREIASINKDYQKAYEFQTQYNSLNDSIFSLNNSARLTLLEYQYEQEKKEFEQNLINIEKHKKSKTIIWAILFMFLLSVSTSTLYIFYQKNKIRKAIYIKEKIELESMRLKEQLEYRNKKIVLMTMNLFERNELINTVINKLKSILPNAKKSNYPEINDIIIDLKSNYQENILKEFEFHFNKVHINFYKKINDDFQNLTSNEIRLCAFLKMNMSTKDIASLTHQTTNSIEVARTRLRKKLNLSNSEIDLVKFFAQY